LSYFTVKLVFNSADVKKRHGIDIKAYHSLTRHDGTTKTILWVGALEEIGRD